jgi:hypothetical protein
MPILAIKRPQQEVELFNFALHNDCVLVVSEQTSKRFICYQIINEFLQNESTKLAVVVLVDSSACSGESNVVILLILLIPTPDICVV